MTGSQLSTLNSQLIRGWHWTGGTFQPCESLPLSDRGFRYGMSVFESLRVTCGGAEFFAQHLARLVQACAEREFRVDESALFACASLFQDAAQSGFARIYVTAGDGAPSAAIEQPRVFVFLEDRISPNPDDPWKIALHDASYHAPFGGLKTGNYWFNCEARARAQRRGFDEALLFNDRAELVSASMANVFLLRDGVLCTPPCCSGARPGVIREWVIERHQVEERCLRREDVIAADEIFLTGSWIGVMPVATLEDRALGPRTIGQGLAAELEAFPKPSC